MNVMIPCHLHTSHFSAIGIKTLANALTFEVEVTTETHNVQSWEDV
jgi:hypothetical protein